MDEGTLTNPHPTGYAEHNANELDLVIDGPDEKQLADEVGKLFVLKNPEL